MARLRTELGIGLRARNWPGLVTFLALLAVWEAASAWGHASPALLPPPSRVLPLAWAILASGSFLAPLAETLSLLALGYGIGCACGCALGLAMGWSAPLFRLLEPLTELIRPIPKPALIPPLFLFLGLGTATKVTVVALAAFFPVLINTVQAVRGIDPVTIGTARTFGYSRTATLFNTVLPASLPMILTGMRVSLGLSLVLVILAEMLVDSRGIGFLILDMQRSFRVPEMYAWIIILGLLGLLLNALFEWIEGKLVAWRPR
jgi:ABC-type nitrate/sulfonate/bicarbonate transport system permease component